ncbi:hypothetical protein LP52_01415 [Streptomonospora alba]|uniref:Uncharacterized protein n=1 Tax=Streptomonospora alba TaxID=183763 RepID=A0A0C2FM82_9ACTN|nr:hypothetical protein [Streptomonospora alba]KII00505.1 hypothetical protein LP52_01415 [Streptomonospora alba]
MPDKDYDYCKIFVKNASFDELQSLMVDAFGGDFNIRTMQFDGYSIDIEKNTTVTEEGSEDFVQWPVFIEFFGEDDRPEGVAVEVVTRILNSLWGNGVRAVAACDFEDELPWSGGIARP